MSRGRLVAVGENSKLGQLMRQGWYLVAILDWYGRYVLSWRLSNTLDVVFCPEALKETLEFGKPRIFNSDQGSQFTSLEFIGRLEIQGIAISMDGRGQALDNVFVERLRRSELPDTSLGSLSPGANEDHVVVWGMKE